ncbi:hypothetical protein CAPTEDRAFT_187897 [Capitella teleta]|uniref:Uncharacterized protein n=1 Tax=Capitella teleta TaxID=283909 RepID=R7V3W1_CAPTE|nr:hypothetical protein CAPTEDRAFT_187897 [Capitella teleta]|eukprot:ELU13219.1 hypothetical protein CAPTEDRAFT_187897 [Capitella teleta]
MNLRFTVDIDGVEGSETELQELVTKLIRAPRKFGMEIGSEKTKMVNNRNNPLFPLYIIEWPTVGKNLIVRILGSLMHLISRIKYHSGKDAIPGFPCSMGFPVFRTGIDSDKISGSLPQFKANAFTVWSAKQQRGLPVDFRNCQMVIGVCG